MTAAVQLTVVVWVHSLAQELPHAMGAGKKKKKKERKKLKCGPSEIYLHFAIQQKLTQQCKSTLL